MSENKRDISVDLDRIDAHLVSDREYEEIPELTDEDFARGHWSVSAIDRTNAALKIDADVLARFRATGPGWEDRINRILRDAAAMIDAA